MNGFNMVSHAAAVALALSAVVCGCSSLPEVACLKTKGYALNAEPSHPDGTYAKGEDVTFVFLATKDAAPVADADVAVSLYVPGNPLAESRTVRTDAEGRAVLTVAAPACPGWVYAVGNLKSKPDAKGKVNTLARFDVGAMCDRGAIRPALPPPADFRAFWDAEIAKLRKVPMNPRLEKVELKGEIAKKIDCCEFTLDCVGPRPATGFVSKPKGAKPKSLPIIAMFQGSSGSVVSPGDTTYYGEVAISVVANKFGIPNRLSPAERVAKGYEADYDGERFRFRGRSSRDDIVFKWMILRDLRVVEFAKSLPEWNGKVLVTNGESLGGAQSLAVGALDPDVTFTCACVPALSDHNGARAGRRNGWPRLWTPGADGKPQNDEDSMVSEAARYVDSSNFCTLFTPSKEVSIGTGWIDDVCPPEGVVADFNAIPAGVVKNFWFNPKAGHGAGNGHGGKRIEEILGK